MEVKIKREGYIYLVENAFQKGFETYHNLGKDLDDPRWKDEKAEIDETLEKKSRKKKK